MKSLATIATLLAWAAPSGAGEDSPSGAGEDSPSPVAGQTLPSGYYLRDDVQYFPPGPEFKLTNRVQSLEEYELESEALDENAGFGDPEDSENADEYRHRINVGIGVQSEFGFVLRLTLEDKDRGILFDDVALPLTVIARPTSTGLSAFTKWYLDERANTDTE